MGAWGQVLSVPGHPPEAEEPGGQPRQPRLQEGLWPRTLLFGADRDPLEGATPERSTSLQWDLSPSLVSPIASVRLGADISRPVGQGAEWECDLSGSPRPP